MSRYAIVVIGYNRPLSIIRLLDVLGRCYYDETVDLIISIDNSGKKDVEEIADSFEWGFGEKKVLTYPERLGLRNHILSCGNQLSDYEALAVFEDDTVPADGFFLFMKEAVEKYKDDEKVAGISLYNHLWNVHVNMPFEPCPSRFDAYFIQFAQSWGQIWMRKQWLDFVEWYKNNNEEFGQIDGIPSYVCGWPKSSWLKYHIRYCIEKDLYFVYPYHALSTCFSDVGEHCDRQDSFLQVPMISGKKTDYKFPNITDDDCIIYDSYFERRWLNGKIGNIDLSDVCVDLYGHKNGSEKKRYILSMKSLSYKRVMSFGLHYRPHEQNVVLQENGDDIILYDTSIIQTDSVGKMNEVKEFQYRFRLHGKTKLMAKCVLNKMKSRILK